MCQKRDQICLYYADMDCAKVNKNTIVTATDWQSMAQRNLFQSGDPKKDNC